MSLGCLTRLGLKLFRSPSTRISWIFDWHRQVVKQLKIRAVCKRIFGFSNNNLESRRIFSLDLKAGAILWAPLCFWEFNQFIWNSLSFFCLFFCFVSRQFLQINKDKRFFFWSQVFLTYTSSIIVHFNPMIMKLFRWEFKNPSKNWVCIVPNSFVSFSIIKKLRKVQCNSTTLFLFYIPYFRE